MKRIRYEARELMLAWAEEHMPDFSHFREDAQCIGLERDGRLCAVTVYDAFSPTNCFVSIASDNSPAWMTRAYIAHVFTYPFIQCGLARISCAIAQGNTRSLRFTRHFGWTQEGVMRHGGPDGQDILLFGMLRSECRWLPKTLLPLTGQRSPLAV